MSIEERERIRSEVRAEDLSLEVNVESLDQALVVSIRPLAVTDVTPYSYR